QRRNSRHELYGRRHKENAVYRNASPRQVVPTVSRRVPSNIKVAQPLLAALLRPRSTFATKSRPVRQLQLAWPYRRPVPTEVRGLASVLFTLSSLERAS